MTILEFEKEIFRQCALYGQNPSKQQPHLILINYPDFIDLKKELYLYQIKYEETANLFRGIRLVLTPGIEGIEVIPNLDTLKI